jgi:hypothetical protein
MLQADLKPFYSGRLACSGTGKAVDSKITRAETLLSLYSSLYLFNVLNEMKVQ